MKKDSKMSKAFAQEVKRTAKYLAEQDHLTAEESKRVETLLDVIYSTCMEVFTIAPSLDGINVEKQMVSKPKRKANKNKTREFIVKRKGQKGLEHWCVNGVKKDKAFLNVWSNSPHLEKISVLADPCLGFLYVSTHNNQLFEAFYENTDERVLIAAADAEDAKNMMLVAVNRNMVPANKFQISRLTTIKKVLLYSSDRSMEELCGGIFEVGKSSGRYMPRFDVLQFDDFRDGKHKEFCSHE